ncbi:hypothetical protein Q5P01_022932 [Channa striata]|uniref:Uncharacterized protein n=1 Tax=Channa striata TaxID=64152 RepID=A0AA88LS06_CHASR|nr:hypothetical protein Q5P01_022932 [Channa striata]
MQTWIPKELDPKCSGESPSNRNSHTHPTGKQVVLLSCSEHPDTERNSARPPGGPGLRWECPWLWKPGHLLRRKPGSWTNQTRLWFQGRFSNWMLLRLLEVLVLSSLCSTMLLPNGTKEDSKEDDGSTTDPNTHYWDGPDSDHSTDPTEKTPVWTGISREGLLPLPPAEEPPVPTLPNSSFLDASRAFGSTSPVVPPVPDTTICDFLMSSPVPPPIDQIPYFCFCSHCKGTAGPKGDRGDRGPPGM